MTQTVADRYTEKIFWEINIPKGTRGSSIESFNIERKIETEFLWQRNVHLKIKFNSTIKNNKRLFTTKFRCFLLRIRKNYNLF